MMNTYWPASNMSEIERVEKSAKRVGLNLPSSSPISDLEKNGVKDNSTDIHLAQQQNGDKN